MIENTEMLLKACFALTALLNPLSVTPLFLSLNENTKPSELKPIAAKSSITVGVVLVTSIMGGSLILNFFGISIHSFTLGGGFLSLW
jgi:multiple antibiotic resistance protein